VWLGLISGNITGFWRVDWIEQGLTSHQTNYRSYRGQDLDSDSIIRQGTEGNEDTDTISPNMLILHTHTHTHAVK